MDSCHPEAPAPAAPLPSTSGLPPQELASRLTAIEQTLRELLPQLLAEESLPPQQLAA